MLISSEKTHSIHGVAGRMYPRHAWDDERFSAQKWISEGRPFPGDEYGAKARIHAEIRFDDELRNGRNSFSVTARVSGAERRIDNGTIGCHHDGIAAAFPELAHLIKWHLCDTAGPMHYVANTVFLAGDRDAFGKREGEPSSVAEVIQFGDVPMRYRLEKGLAPFLREILSYDPEGQATALIPIAVAYEGKPGAYRFAPKYQFSGQPPLKWHECAFDTEEEAARFADSFLNHKPAIYALATTWSEGKPRELDAARRVAVWLDATDAELSAPREELKAALEARLPALVAEFRADMKAAGLAWAPSEVTSRP